MQVIQSGAMLPTSVGTTEKVNYYLEAVKLYYYNCILYNQVILGDFHMKFDKLMEERNSLVQRVQKAQSNAQDSSPLVQPTPEMQFSKKKKVRRCASQIERLHGCKFPGCMKQYGTEGSLLQHMRLKHEDFVRVNQLKFKPVLTPKELIQLQMQKQEQEQMMHEKNDEYQQQQ